MVKLAGNVRLTFGGSGQGPPMNQPIINRPSPSIPHSFLGPDSIVSLYRTGCCSAKVASTKNSMAVVFRGSPYQCPTFPTRWLRKGWLAFGHGLPIWRFHFYDHQCKRRFSRLSFWSQCLGSGQENSRQGRTPWSASSGCYWLYFPSLGPHERP